MIIQQLRQRAEQAREEIEQGCQYCLSVCVSAGCVSAGADRVLDALKRQVKARGRDVTWRVSPTGCMGPCSGGPVLRIDSVEGESTLYSKVGEEDVKGLLDHLEKGSIDNEHKMDSSAPFFARQRRVVLSEAGRIDPERIEHALAAGAYQALARALHEMQPSQIIEEITASGLRGRGGAGYPTGLKWGTVAKSAGRKRYVVCNGDEGDPGAFMDRAILESDPHRVLEGLAIAAVAVGAEQGYLYVRAEYPLAIARLRKAIKQAEKGGYLGKDMLESGRSLHLELRLGAGAFVCGEETALLASVEGKRGTPRPRPPYPAQSGLFGEPTLLNNVETYANIAPIINHGADWFRSLGTPGSAGTKVFALAGNIVNTGLIEVEMGTTLREIVEQIGGGVPEGKTLKAVQTGGPSGGCIPAEHLDVPVDYDSLTQLGSFMGSGGMIVMDGSSDMVDVARYFMDFSMSESCGKCAPCRIGTVQLYRMLQKIVEKKGHARDIASIEELAELLRECSLCGLGQAAPNPVLSTLRYFRDEYNAKLLPDNVWEEEMVS